jgi:hypothetical protein
MPAPVLHLSVMSLSSSSQCLPREALERSGALSWPPGFSLYGFVASQSPCDEMDRRGIVACPYPPYATK